MLQAHLFNAVSIIPSWQKYQVRLALFNPISGTEWSLSEVQFGESNSSRTACVCVCFCRCGVQQEGMEGEGVNGRHQKPCQDKTGG